MSKFPLEKGTLKSLTETSLKALGVAAPPPVLGTGFACYWGRNGWCWRIPPDQLPPLAGHSNYFVGFDGPNPGDNYAFFYPSGFTDPFTAPLSTPPTPLPAPANQPILINSTAQRINLPPYPDTVTGYQDGMVYPFTRDNISCTVTCDKATDYSDGCFPFTYNYPTGDGDARVLLPEFTILYNNPVKAGLKYITVSMGYGEFFPHASTATGEVYFHPPIGDDVLLTAFDYATGFTGQPPGHEGFSQVIITFRVPDGGGKIKLVIRNTDFCGAGETPGKANLAYASYPVDPYTFITVPVDLRSDGLTPIVANIISIVVQEPFA